MYMLNLINKLKSSNVPVEDYPIPSDFSKNNPNYFLQISEHEGATNFLQIVINSNLDTSEYEKLCGFYLSNIRKEKINSIKEKALSYFENVFYQFFSRSGPPAGWFKDASIEKLKVYFETKYLFLKETNETMPIIEGGPFYSSVFKKISFFNDLHSFNEKDDVKLFSRVLLISEISNVFECDVEIKEKMKNLLTELKELLKFESRKTVVKCYSLVCYSTLSKYKNPTSNPHSGIVGCSEETNQEKLNLFFDYFLETIKSRADYEDCLILFLYLNQGSFIAENENGFKKKIEQLKS